MEHENKEQLQLETAYEQSTQDEDRLKVINEWKALDNTDKSEEWEW
jgi:hypothetical protein